MATRYPAAIAVAPISRSWAPTLAPFAAIVAHREAWIRAVMALQLDAARPFQGPDRGAESPARPELSDAERRVQALTLAVIRRHGHRTSGELESVVASIGHEQALAVLMLIGRYVTHALMVNCLELQPPVASPLENRDA